MRGDLDRQAARQAFLAEAGWADARLEPLDPDASDRRYVRLHRGDATRILMDHPPRERTPDEVAAHLAGADVGRFLAMCERLRGLGLSAPQVEAADQAAGFALLEDFGEARFDHMLARGSAEDELYRSAAAMLSRVCAEDSGKDLALYDIRALLTEAALFAKWWRPHAGLREDVALNEQGGKLWERALAPHVRAERVLVLRDVHAQNLMALDRPEPANVGLLDFQDAVAGHPAYDVISLIDDVRREVSPGVRADVIERYSRDAPIHDGEAFRAACHVYSAQRAAKILGIFARLNHRDGKAKYLTWLPRTWAVLERALEHPELSELRAWFEEAAPPPLREREER
jgi:hypothetical protein